MRTPSRGFTLIELLIVVAIIGIIAAIAIPNLLNAVDKGKQTKTLSDLKAIGVAVEAYAVDNSTYPNAASVPAIKAVIDPVFFNAMPLTDGWAHAIQADSSLTSYTLYSQGKDGVGTSCPPGIISTFDDQICFVNGRFQRYPAGQQQ
jgi:general secretion pathway protein G